jgi:hypothetical protein
VGVSSPLFDPIESSQNSSISSNSQSLFMSVMSSSDNGHLAVSDWLLAFSQGSDICLWRHWQSCHNRNVAHIVIAPIVIPIQDQCIREKQSLYAHYAAKAALIFVAVVRAGEC